jgi:kynurenine formamidase
MPQIIDLSVPLENSRYAPEPFRIFYIGHRLGAALLGLAAVRKHSLQGTVRSFAKWLLGENRIFHPDFPQREALAWEFVAGFTHSGTHVDAPVHFGSQTEGTLSRGIDEIPLDWFYGDGVRLDMRHRRAGEEITVEDVEQELARIRYTLKPFDIPLIWTGMDRYWNTPQYTTEQPGMSREATLWMLRQGVKVIGIDCYGFDIPFEHMLRRYRETRDAGALWGAHFAGREIEYCHIEKLAHLDALPADHGFKIACFPTLVRRGSCGWTRAVALVG